MAVSLRFSPADLLRCRFTVSPLFETSSAIRLTSPAEAPGPHRRWLDEVRPHLTGLDLRPVLLTQPRRGYSADFLAPPPGGPHVEFADELARVSATPLGRVHTEIARSLLETPGAAESETGRLLLGDPAVALEAIVSVLRQAWELMVEPHWQRVRALLDADVSFQSRRLAEGGLDKVFAELHPQLRWHDNVLIRERGDDEMYDLDGRGLILMPSAFKWDQVIVVADEPWQPSVVYPARGLGELWQPARGTPDAALARLLGKTRASILIGLSEPTSTSNLAHRHALAPATVSEHLTILRDAGFLVGERHRHEVRYRRTALGTSVVRRRP